jgi:hypothetical protein
MLAMAPNQIKPHHNDLHSLRNGRIPCLPTDNGLVYLRHNTPDEKLAVSKKTGTKDVAVRKGATGGQLKHLGPEQRGKACV